MTPQRSRPTAQPRARAATESPAGSPAPPPRLPTLGYWGVVAAWMVVISTLSTEPFSAANTNRYLDPILRYFFPHLTAAGFALAHFIVRKSAHFIEFFVLGSLIYWACRRGRPPLWRSTWMLQALGLAVLYALADEAHQAFVPNRTASLMDSGIDSLGAAASQLIIFLRSLWRRRSRLTH